jgi:hypothetical protein
MVTEKGVHAYTDPSEGKTHVYFIKETALFANVGRD